MLLLAIKLKIKSPLVLRELQKADSEILKLAQEDPNIEDRDGLWIRKWKKNEERDEFEQILLPGTLRLLVLKNFHDDLLTGLHSGTDRTYEKIRQRFWWPTMLDDIKNYIGSCLSCQIRKNSTMGRLGPLQSISINHTFELVSMDLVGHLTTSKRGNNYVVVFVEHLTNSRR